LLSTVLVGFMNVFGRVLQSKRCLGPYWRCIYMSNQPDR